MPRWLIAFEARDPRSLDRTWEVGVSEQHYRHLQIHGHEKSLARLLLVREVLEGGTTHLYEGWSRPDRDDCFVYAGCPKHDFKNLRIETPPPAGLVFLVFVLPDGEIDEWTWRKLSDDEASRPDGIQGRLIWSANPS